MLARLTIEIPFAFVIPASAQFTVYGYELNGYLVRAFPPSYTSQRRPSDPDEISVNDEPAVLATMLRIDFHKETFDRAQGADVDPPEHVIMGAVMSLLTRIRYVTRGYLIRPPSISTTGAGVPLSESASHLLAI